jgi:mannose-1-phosphate guanylyltransferase
MDWAVILAGGSGSRFWPLSSPTRPKQLLPLVGARSTIEETFDRLTGFIPLSRTLVVTGPTIAPMLIKRLGLDPANVLVEPRPMSTGPALVWATCEASRRDSSAAVLALHSDWAVGDPAAFVRTAETALFAARSHDRLVTVGIVPSRPDTGYGYIVPGTPLDRGARTVARFAEKPDASTALNLMAEGALWNTGLFAWTAARLLTEVQNHTPEIAPHLIRLAEGDVAAFFSGVTAISIDVGVLERSHAVAVVPGHFDWDDVGTWEALARVRPRDRSGNVAVGPVTLFESSDCIAWSEGTPIVISGLKDLVVIQANGRILVLDRSRAADLKRTLDALPAEVRDLPA